MDNCACEKGRYIVYKMKQRIRIVLACVILIATALAFIYYLQHHPEIVLKLTNTNPIIIIQLVVLYALFFVSLAVVLHFSTRIFNKDLSLKDNFLLSAYSSLANFFGPGQSGPGVRAIYLKKKLQLPIKDFIFATFIYYAFYATFSALMLMAGVRPWWQTLAVVVAAAGASYWVIRRHSKKNNPTSLRQFSFINIGAIAIATAAQLIIQTLIYWVEVSSLNSHIAFTQVVSYTGAANFSLFVALTPGAIGIRESFLLFTQQIHHIGSDVIVAASLIDRAAYIILLILLFVFVAALLGRGSFKQFRDR